MRAFRICSAAHAVPDGEGARFYGGRWNPRGVAVVYASSTLALAALESLVHVDVDTAPDDLVWVELEIPDDLPVETVGPDDLPRDWRTIPAPEELKAKGEAWVGRGRAVALVVPSVLVPSEQNVLLNPAHPAFRRVKASTPQPFSFDARLVPGMRGVREAPGAYGAPAAGGAKAKAAPKKDAER